jgi:DNA-binding response OmpR family regulator
VEAFFAQAATAASLSLPRLIIADCLISGMEAEAIMTAVRTVPAYRRVPIIFFSTLPEAEGQRLSAACGATMFVNKPGELRAFVEAVSTMVRRWGGGGEGLDLLPAREEKHEEENGAD